MTKREKTVWVLLCMVLLITLTAPIRGLFIDGVYSWHIRQPEFWNMVLEVVGLALVLGAVWFFMRDHRGKLLLTGAVCAVFIWCHVVFLPMVVSGGYGVYLYLMGRSIRNFQFREAVGMKDRWLWDFILGCAVVITLFCLMSAVGVGGIPQLKAAVAVTGTWVVISSVWTVCRKHNKSKPLVEQNAIKKRRHPLTWVESLLLVFIIVMVLIQVGRMNISLDFDSLWYGVRSPFILNNGRGIYENMGSVGLVYTYPKGLEVLLLPLSDLSSFSYLIFFNVWMTVLSLAAVFRIGCIYTSRAYALLAAACVSSIPSIMNMSITAKTDSMTLLVQLAMILFLLYYLQEKEVRYLLAGLGACFLSWTLKPTAVVFSTVVFGMSVLYLLGTRQLLIKGPLRVWAELMVPVIALVGIWARTMLMVGIPVTSVFSSIFLKLGFTLKYPFSVLPLNGNSEEGKNIRRYLTDTLYRMFLSPEGEDMSHVVIAWGTSLLFLLAIVSFLTMFVRRCQGERSPKRDSRNLVRYAHTVMIPFVLVCLVSLTMLGQIDGNYFMLLYVGIVLYGCVSISHIECVLLKKSILVMVIPVLLLNVPVSMVSNWAWSLGFTPISVVNKGRMNHKELQYQKMAAAGNVRIWNTLSADPQTRVIAAGEHPWVFQFPCNVQSYDDITSTWGNVRLVKTMDAFTEYLAYAKTDYVYMQAGYVDRNSRCYELMGYLVEAGILTDVVYESGNFLGRVNLQGDYGPEASSAYERYKTEYQVKQEG